MKKAEVIKELVNIYGYGLPAALTIFNYLSDSGTQTITRQELDIFLEENY